MLPAVSQGILGIEVRAGDQATAALLAPLDDTGCPHGGQRRACVSGAHRRRLPGAGRRLRPARRRHAEALWHDRRARWPHCCGAHARGQPASPPRWAQDLAEELLEERRAGAAGASLDIASARAITEGEPPARPYIGDRHRSPLTHRRRSSLIAVADHRYHMWGRITISAHRRQRQHCRPSIPHCVGASRWLALDRKRRRQRQHCYGRPRGRPRRRRRQSIDRASTSYGRTSVLQGKRIVITRAEAQAAPLIARLRALGAEALACPAIAIAPPADEALLDRAISQLGQYDWLLVTSANGARALLGRMAELGADAAPLRRMRVGADRPGHGAGAGRAGHRGRLCAERTMSPRRCSARSAMWPGSASCCPVPTSPATRWRRACARSGALVDAVAAYRTVPGAGARRAARLAARGRDRRDHLQQLLDGALPARRPGGQRAQSPGGLCADRARRDHLHRA